MDADGITLVDLGDDRERVEARIRSGRYSSASAVIRAGLDALDRLDADEDSWLREAVAEALDDPRPLLTSEQVFGAMEDRAKRRAARQGRDA